LSDYTTCHTEVDWPLNGVDMIKSSRQRDHLNCNMCVLISVCVQEMANPTAYCDGNKAGY